VQRARLIDRPRTLDYIGLAFDEFQAAGQLGSRIFDVMRTRFQAQRAVSYAFLGSEEGILEQLFSGKGRAFYRFALPLDLADAAGHRFGIDPDDWLSYIQEKLTERKLTIGDAEVDRILDATGGHPQDTMQVCAALYYLMRDAGLRAVTAEAIGVAIEQALRELSRGPRCSGRSPRSRPAGWWHISRAVATSSSSLSSASTCGAWTKLS